MAERSITIDHNDKRYTGYVATIRSTTFGVNHHGILSADLTLEWQSSGVSFGGYALDEPVFENGDRHGKFLGRFPTAYGLDYLVKIMETVGENWEALRGKQVIVLFDYSPKGTWGMSPKGIAHLTDDRVFIPAEHVEEWKKKEEATTV